MSVAYIPLPCDGCNQPIELRSMYWTLHVNNYGGGTERAYHNDFCLTRAVARDWAERMQRDAERKDVEP